MTHEDTAGNSAGGDVGPEDQVSATPLDELRRQLELAQKEMLETKDRHLRAAAEMENFRRRMEREKADLLRYASENVMRDLMPVLDSFDKAIGSAPQSDQNAANVIQGMQMVQKQLLDALAKHGLEPIKAPGEPFDPNFHQAIQKIESADVSLETVQQEFAKGYLINGRLLRAAMVSVAVPVSSSQA
jgi:molecular chaperone GrpE